MKLDTVNLTKLAHAFTPDELMLKLPKVDTLTKEKEKIKERELITQETV